ncbi:MAG: 1-deoxy-D-xylulose-5-phosphate synthase [Trueperaceae bacterium]|nr:1-deoxy-D-xylulose-5-phosphate synthase [Trueperaceae bacterium]
MSLLDHISTSADVARLRREQLPQLAAELRAEIIDVCAETGGHLASSLGAVELTVALHYVHDSLRDRIVWDVGHQTYGHKILTGRRNRMRRIRQRGGPAGFTTSSESPHDALTVGHASTSLAAALGMALARDARAAPYDVVAVIGDGALTGGMALAALNTIGHVKPRMTIVLNDNEMSISENVGALNEFMRRLQVQPWLRRAESRGKAALRDVWAPLAEFGSRAKKATRRFFDPASNNPFHAMGLRYVGPIDGHDVEQIAFYLAHIRELDGPTMLHLLTRKGKGYDVAEADPITWHGASRYDASNPVAAGKGYQWSDAFGDAAVALTEHDDRVWVITPAMREGSGLVRYSKAHPERYIDVGIAEDVAVTTAAGLALRGEKPIVAIYSTFLQRGYDQVIHDVALESLDVVFAIDRAGLVGADGMTHQGVFDMAYLRPIPNLSIAMPKDAVELRSLLKGALERGGPVAVRWPRGSVVAAPEVAVEAWPAVRWGSWEVVAGPGDPADAVAVVLAFGVTLGYALAAVGAATDVTVVNARFLKPLDEDLLARWAGAGVPIVTVEDHVLAGGLGAAVTEFLADVGLDARIRRLGIDDAHVPHGDPAQQHEELGYGVRGIADAVAELRGRGWQRSAVPAPGPAGRAVADDGVLDAVSASSALR